MYKTTIYSLAVGDGFFIADNAIYCCCGTIRIKKIVLPENKRVKLLTTPSKDLLNKIDLISDKKQVLGNFANRILRLWPKRKFKYSNKGFIKLPYGLNEDQVENYIPQLRKRKKI